MSKSSELDKQAKLYLLDAMRDKLEEYDFTAPEGMDNEEVADRVRMIFCSEYQWQLERYGVIRAIQEWLQGLALPIAFDNWDIINLAKDWRSIPEDATERQEDKILDNYWHFMANKLSQLFDGYRVPKETK